MSITRTRFASFATLAAAAACSSSKTTTTCGPGTTLVNGQCVIADAATDSVTDSAASEASDTGVASETGAHDADAEADAAGETRAHDADADAVVDVARDASDVAMDVASEVGDSAIEVADSGDAQDSLPTDLAPDSVGDSNDASPVDTTSEACSGYSATLTTTPPVMVFLLDRSLAMANLPADTGSIATNYFPSWVPQPAGDTLCEFYAITDAEFAQTKFGVLRAALDSAFGTGQLQQSWQVAVNFFAAPGHVLDNNLGFCAVNLYSTPTIPLDTVANNHPLLDCWTGMTAITDSSCASVTNVTTEPNSVYCGVNGDIAGTPVSLAPVLPSGEIPMASALTGTIEYLQGLTVGSTGESLANASRVVVLMTNGDPNPTAAPCAPLSAVVTAASNGYSGSPQVLTYTIGLPGATAANLEQIATVGGGLNFTTDAANLKIEINTAIAQIARELKTCSFGVPAPSAPTEVIDPNSVSVQLTVGGTTIAIPRDVSEVAGWDYTNGGRQISLFGSPCDAVESSPGATLQILAACDVATADGASVCLPTGGSCADAGTCCLGYYCASNGECAVNPQ